MKSEIDVFLGSTRSRWFRLGCSLVLALTLALVLLLIPIAAGTTIAIPIPALHQMGPTTQSLSLLAHAQGGTALQLSKSAPATVDQGDLLLYTLRVTNTGTTTATAVVVTDTIPSLGTWTIYAPPGDGNAGVSVDSDGDWYVIHPSGSDFIQWGTADAFIPFASGLSPGGTAELYFEVRVVEPVPDQTEITNSDYAAEAQNAPRTTGNTVVTRVNAPHWAIGKDVSASTIQPGEYLTYTITAWNDGHLEATGLYTITDVIPEYTTYITSMPPATKVDNLLTWAFSETLAVGASREVTYVVQVTETLAHGLSIVNDTYSVTGSNVYTGAVGDPVITDVQAPVLNIVKTDYTDPIWPGGTLTYTLAYSNTGGADATSVVISDTIDGNTTFVTSSPSPSNNVGSTYYWDIGDLPAGDADTILITVSVASPLSSGTQLTNTANVGSAGGYADQDIETTTVLGNPDLNLVKDANTDIIEPGDLITYTISYSNSGDAPAVDVHITDTIDANTSFVASDPPHDSGSYVWEIGELWPSDTYQITVTVRVTDSLPNGTLLTNDAIIWGTGNITDTDQAIVSVESAPILHVVKEASSSIIEPGDTLTYTIWYSNTGNAPATGVVITDTLPPELHFQSANPMPDNPPGGGDPWQAWDIDTLNVGGPYSVTLVVTSEDTIADNTQLINQVAMSSVETGTVTAQETITVHAVELAVEKTASPGTVKADESITYTITVRNDGHAVADNVRITDTLPISIVQSSVISSASPGVAFDSAAPPTYVWTTPTLDALSSITISISGRLVTSPWSASGDVFFNTVEVSSDDTETNLLNNVDQEQATGRPGDPYTMMLVAAPVQTTVGNTIQVTATIADQWGNPAYDGETVDFATSLGSISPPSTNPQDGVALSSVSSLQPGVAAITAKAGSVEATTSVTFTVGAPDHFVFTPAIPSPQTAGVPFEVIITVMDEYDNPVPTYTTSADLADVTDTMLPTSTGTGWNNGVWTGTVTIIGAMRNDSITVGDGVITDTSNLFDVRPGPADSATLAGPDTMPPCGATSAYTATVLDQYGNSLWAGTPITFYLSDLGGTGAILVPTNPYVVQTDDAGTVVATVQSASDTGLVRLEVDIDGDILGDAAKLVNILGVGIATDMQIQAVPSTIPVLNTSEVTTTLRDCVGQAIPGATIDLTLSGLGSLSPIGGTTDGSGVFTSTFTAGLSPGTAVVTATNGTLFASTSITITGGPVFEIAKTATPIPGSTVSVTETITYLIAVTNTGTTATGFRLTDLIPTNSQYVPGSASGSSWATIGGGDPVWATTDIFSGSGQVLTVTFAVTPTGSGNISNQVTIDSEQTEPQTSNVVSHLVNTGESVFVYLPIVLRNGDGTTPPAPTEVNLVIDSISFLGQAPVNDGDKYHVQVVIRNAGTETANTDFWVDLYLNPVSTPVPNQVWQNMSQSGTLGVSNCPNDPTCYGRAWQVTTDLAPGDVVVLDTQMPADVRYDRWPSEGVPYVSSRHKPITALVDSWSSGEYWFGNIYESDEGDNLPVDFITSLSGDAVLQQQTTSPISGVSGGRRPVLPSNPEE